MLLIEPARFRSGMALIFTLVMPISCSAAQQPIPQSPAQQLPQNLLSVEFLLGSAPLEAPLATTAFKPRQAAPLAAQPFSGLLILEPNNTSSNIEILVDTYKVAGERHLDLAKLPPFSFEYVSDGSAIIPVKRTPQRGNHPYWEILLEPGRVWTDASDRGWSRAALPFSLKEKNQNCTHNGLMTFLYKQDGSISRVAWQIANETCLYLKVDLWGIVKAVYTPGPVSASSELIAAYRKEIASRLPVRSFTSLGNDYPGLDQKAFQPSGIEDASVYGFVINGVHYRSECPTRYGPYPFCDGLDLPSYSLSKSLFAGLTYFILESRWPEFSAMSISSLIPECQLPDKRWDKVTPVHLINMNTGNYDSNLFNADEDTGLNTFFVAETHADKLQFSCEAWPQRSPAGSQWVYHTSDTYLMGVAMNNFIKQKLGDQADIHRDLLYTQLLEPLNLSPVLQWSQRTYDDHNQPFTGFGLILHSDDLARIALALNSDSTTSESLAATDFESAMFRTGAPWPASPGKSGVAYSHGFWGVDVSSWIGCSTATWVPFMSGYGGIAVALFPNGGVYYFFTDSNQHSFREAAIEANKALNFCKE